MTPSYIPLTDIARIFGIDKSGARKYLLKKGFVFLRVRRKETGNQQELALSTEDWKSARDVREKDGFVVNE